MGGTPATCKAYSDSPVAYESGAVRPVVDRTYPLAAVPEAMRYLETEHARAKVIITV